MAIRNRKLFPTLSDTNQTTYCPEFCDPTTCPYDCPEFYLYPPPPPALALPPSPASQPGHDKLSPSFITASALLVGFFVLLGYYLITAKSCFRQRSQNRRPPAPSDGGDEEFVDGNRVDHPIWFIATVGLQQSVINAITVCNYRKGDDLIEGTECSVCLNEFREGENLRLLPKCSHAFHIPCIDRWLGSHTNCPLCRANIVSPDSIGVFSTRPLQELMPMEPQGQDSTLSIDIQAEDFRERNGMSGNLGINGVSGNMGGTGERRDTQEGGDRGESILKESVNRDSGIQETQKEAAEEMESVKSSSSSVPVNALSSSAESCQIGTQGLDLAGEGGGFAKIGVVGPVAAARSLSCNGGFYLSRHSRSTSSILP